MRDERLRQDIVSRLKADYGFRENGDWLQAGKCPACGRKELFSRSDSPWLLRCGRQNKCGSEFHIKERYPEFFEKFNARFPATTKDRNATAHAYMERARGLPPEKMTGWYRQEKFWHRDAVGPNKGTATVRFDIDRQNDIYMERFVEPVSVREADGKIITRKQHFGGRHGGLWWQPPGMEIKDGDEVWLVEGCIDACSLALAGLKSVAILSCNNYPAKALERYRGRPVKWVLALDNDKAGRKYMLRHARKMRDGQYDVSAALVPQKRNSKTDWNDVWIEGRLSPKDLKAYRYAGALLLAETAMQKALMIWAHTQVNGFEFDFLHRLYWFQLDPEKYAKAVEDIRGSEEGHHLDKDQITEKAVSRSGSLAEIANCHPEFLYFQVNELTDESWYYARITFPHGARPVKNTFTGAQLSAPTEFKKRMLSVAAGSVFTGSKSQLDRLLKKRLFGIKTVDTVDYIGYSREHSAYIFNDRAIAGGKVTAINDEDYFEVGKFSLKSLNQSVHLHIGKRDEYLDAWVQLVWNCFGAKGMVAVAFWFGTLFAEQIRTLHKSYPFLEIVGEPGAGKSTLIEFLWKLFGRQDYEGFDPSKSTMAARSRNFAQISNLPVVLIEADRDQDTAHSRKFDWDELKTAYNGRASRARGVKTSGNETYEPPFRGSIVISQNAEISASEAILQRIIHLGFDRSTHSSLSKKSAERLESMPIHEVSHFLERACVAENRVLEMVRTQMPEYEKALLSLPELTSVRIAKNHAQILALVDALVELIDLSEEQVAEIQHTVHDLAKERQAAIVADHPVVAEFWETFDFLNSSEESGQALNHTKDERLIAVNLNHFVQVANMNKQQVPPLTDLKRDLRSSKSRKFQCIKTVKTGIQDAFGYTTGKSVKCWVFENRA